MAVYWLLFLYFAAGTLLGRRPDQVASGEIRAGVLIGAVIVALLVGLRFEVGADWPTYKFIFSYAGYADLDRVLELGDFGFQYLNWQVQQLGGELWHVNLVCGTLFAWGLYRFAKDQPEPWLAFVVAVPYLVIVVAMGYTRQAVAIGLLMAGIASYVRTGSLVRFLAWVAFAALFHKTAVVALPLVALAGRQNRFVNTILAAVSGVLLYSVFLEDSVDQLVKSYIDQEYSSQGAAIRVVMSLVPAVIFLLFRKRFAMSEREDLIWRNFSLAAIGLLALLFLLPSSTVVDRLALYVIPLQIAVWSRVPGHLLSQSGGRFLVVAYAFLIQLTWLNFADHAEFWVPYQWVLS